MAKAKITILKKTFNEDMAQRYCQPGTSICTAFEEGQEYVVDGLNQPENFCAWAWNDIHKVLLTINSGGSFIPWMKDEKMLINLVIEEVKKYYT